MRLKTHKTPHISLTYLCTEMEMPQSWLNFHNHLRNQWSFFYKDFNVWDKCRVCNMYKSMNFITHEVLDKFLWCHKGSEMLELTSHKNKLCGIFFSNLFIRYICMDTDAWNKEYIDGLVQERHNSIANALELCLSCTNPSIWHNDTVHLCLDAVDRYTCVFIPDSKVHGANKGPT